MKKRLSKKDSIIFKKKLDSLAKSKQNKVSENIIHNSDGTITLLDYVIISEIAESIFDSNDYSNSISNFINSSDSYTGDGGDFGGGGSSSSWDDSSSNSDFSSNSSSDF